MQTLIARTSDQDRVYKRPNEIRKLEVDWTEALPEGVTIVTSTFTVDDPALDLDNLDQIGTAAEVMVSAGLANKQYEIVNAVSLSNGELYEYPFTVVCKE